MFFYLRHYGAMVSFKGEWHGEKYNVSSPSHGLHDKIPMFPEVQEPKIEVDGKMVDNPKFPVFDAWRTEVGDAAVAKLDKSQVGKGIQEWNDAKAAARAEATTDDVLNDFIKQERKDFDEYNAGWTPTAHRAAHSARVGFQLMTAGMFVERASHWVHDKWRGKGNKKKPTTSPASTSSGSPGAAQPPQGAAAAGPEPQELKRDLRSRTSGAQKPEGAEESDGIGALGIFLIILASVVVLTMLGGVGYAIFNSNDKSEEADLEAQES